MWSKRGGYRPFEMRRRYGGSMGDVPVGGFGFSHGRRGAGPGGRRGRGAGRRVSMRAALLALLLERAMYGYEMMQDLQRRTGGIWRPSPGSVYPMLRLLEEEGLVSGREEGGRRQFDLTDAGRAEAQQAAQDPPWNEFTDETVAQFKDLQQAISRAMDALRQVERVGTPAQRDRAIQLLNRTTHQFYAILAEDEAPPGE